VTIVIDSSVALKWVLNEPESEAALALRGEALIAPGFWLAETANALWRHARLGQITAIEALELYDDLADAPITSLPTEPHIRQALSLAVDINYPIYDCLYLAVALHHDTEVVTADRRFAAAVARSAHAGRVRLLGAEGHFSLHEP
jgi:predicted nucleic acid-binding protein